MNIVTSKLSYKIDRSCCVTVGNMASRMKISVFIDVMFLLMGLSCAQPKNCSTHLSALERALYETSTNEKFLNGAFFPPQQQTSRYINVTYSFLTEDGKLDNNCTVSYLWSVGGFLLIQPPSVFRYTSLFFSVPANNLTDLKLQLPHECRPIVDNGTGNCSCGDKMLSENLDILTQQIKQYSKFNNLDQVVRDDTSAARSVCIERLEKEYFKQEVQHYLGTIVVFPIITITLVHILVCTYHCYIRSIITKPSNHYHLAGIASTGFYLAVFVFILDFIAIHDNMNSTAYGDCSKCKTIIEKVLVTNLVFEILLLFGYFINCFVVSFFLLYGSPDNRKSTMTLVCGFFGGESADVCEEKRLEITKLWIVVGFLYIPLYYVSAHMGYILVAWLTEPAKTTSIAILAIAVIVYLYIIFRTLYRIYRAVEGYCDFMRCNKKWNIIFKCLCAPLFGCCMSQHDKDRKKFSMSGLCSATIWGIVMVGFVAVIVASFYRLPFPTISLTNYLENIGQIFLLILATLITYRIISVGETDFTKFLKSLNENYNNLKSVPFHILVTVADEFNTVSANGTSSINVTCKSLYCSERMLIVPDIKDTMLCLEQNCKLRHIRAILQSTDIGNNIDVINAATTEKNYRILSIIKKPNQTGEGQTGESQTGCNQVDYSLEIQNEEKKKPIKGIILKFPIPEVRLSTACIVLAFKNSNDQQLNVLLPPFAARIEIKKSEDETISLSIDLLHSREKTTNIHKTDIKEKTAVIFHSIIDGDERAYVFAQVGTAEKFKVCGFTLAILETDYTVQYDHHSDTTVPLSKYIYLIPDEFCTSMYNEKSNPIKAYISKVTKNEDILHSSGRIIGQVACKLAK